MKDAHRILNKTFLLARCGGTEVQQRELPFGLQTAVLAHWRNSRLHVANGSRMLPALRWAAIIAVFLAIASGAWKWDILMSIAACSEPEVTLINSAFASLD